ncbi:MAG: CAP domain-containing protein, partial [Actinomycetota bacterium]|nr:CAP domain-containing protein [Actinomycetota bacterium]
MSATKRISTGLIAGLLVAALMPATTATAACYVNNENERAFAKKINAARSALGKGKLQLDPELSKAAKVHTREMTSKLTLYHTPTEALKRRVTNWSTLGENVGVGGSVISLHQAF